MKKTLTCTLVFVLLLFSVSRADDVRRKLFVPYQGPLQLDLQSVNPALVLRQRLVTVQVDLLSGGAETKVILNLFDDFVVTATCDRVEQNISGGFAWLGHIDGEETGEVTLVVAGQTMAGSVSLPGRKYHIRPLDERIHVAREILFPLLRSQLLLAEAIPVSVEREVAGLVNLEREIENLHPLTWNDELFAATRGHSADMAQLNYFSHYSLDGREFHEPISTYLSSPH